MNAPEYSVRQMNDRSFICVSSGLFAVTAGVAGQDARPTEERGELSFRT